MERKSKRVCKKRFSCYSKLDVKEEFEYTWTIEDFEVFPGKDELKSSVFPSGNDESHWLVVMNPKPNDYGMNFVALCLEVTGKKDKVRIKYEFFLVNSEGKLCKTEGPKRATFGHNFNSNDPPRSGAYQLGTKDYILDKENGFLADGNLTIFCKISVLGEKLNISPSPLILEEPVNSLSTHFETLWQTGLFSDIVLIIEGRELKAHKNILAARSKVFHGMLTHDTKETQEGRVYIKDLSYDVIKEMLQYMYTGQAPNLVGIEKDLLIAADKYDLPGLKLLCENSLIRNLTRENAEDFITFANMHSAMRLYEAIQAIL